MPNDDDDLDETDKANEVQKFFVFQNQLTFLESLQNGELENLGESKKKEREESREIKKRQKLKEEED